MRNKLQGLVPKIQTSFNLWDYSHRDQILVPVTRFCGKMASSHDGTCTHDLLQGIVPPCVPTLGAIVFRCNNLAETVLDLFNDAIKNNHGLWPSHIRLDYVVENVLVCDEMVAHWGKGQQSFIAGPSTINQRIERMWRDVFRCVCHFFYFMFCAMEQSGILDIDNPIHVFIAFSLYCKNQHCSG